MINRHHEFKAGDRVTYHAGTPYERKATVMGRPVIPVGGDIRIRFDGSGYPIVVNSSNLTLLEDELPAPMTANDFQTRYDGLQAEMKRHRGPHPTDIFHQHCAVCDRILKEMNMLVMLTDDVILNEVFPTV